MRYLLDTNICIYLTRHHPASVAERFRKTPGGAVGISVITYAELCAGIERDSETAEENRRVLELLVTRLPVLPFDTDAARVYGRFRALVPDRRRHAMDRLIAAHAASRNLILVTNNEADFVDFPGLAVENWVR